MEFVHSDDRDYDSIQLDPVVDFEPLDQSDEEEKKEDTLNISLNITTSDKENNSDFEVHTLIPNLYIEIHAAQTPTPVPECTLMEMNTRDFIPASSIARMESLDHFKGESI